jgi:hypothetical protein
MPLIDSLTERDVFQAMLCDVQSWGKWLGYPTTKEGDDSPSLEKSD